MVGNQPWGPGEGPAPRPSEANWAPNYVRQSASRSQTLVVVAIALTAGVATAALILALTRSSAPSAAPITTAPTHSATDIAAAQRKLCDMYQLAAKAVQADTAGTDKALARIATTNGAVMLDNAIVPALDAKHRDAARALAGAYASLTAMSNNAVATDAQYQAALDDITAKNSVMKSVCANGGG